MSSNSSTSHEASALPALRVLGNVRDEHTGLSMTCGGCGAATPIAHMGKIKIYAHEAKVLVPFDIATLATRGTFSLLCDDCLKRVAG